MRPWRKKLAICLLLLGFAMAGVNFVFPPPLNEINQTSSVVKDKDGRWLSGFAMQNGTWRIAADLENTDPRFVERLLAIEDKRFYNHSGVDIPAVFRALKTWHRAGEPLSGASTITMQLVRQVEPRSRTLNSKVIESLRALQLEFWLSKREILEAYLTHIPYGGNIEGIEAASRVYFGKEADQLTDGEIALLIALPQAPEARRPDRKPLGAKQGRNIILDKLVSSEVMDILSASEAKEEHIPLRVAMPETAWLTAYGLAKEEGKQETALNIDLQVALEGLLSSTVDKYEDHTNIAAIIVENKTMAVRAHIASADRARSGGWIDMTRRPRSPGSTLKPFIYALAMDYGLIGAGTKLEDKPTRYGSYSPENFNRRYHGEVRVDEALRHSLNIPAVTLLDEVGSTRLEGILELAGVEMSRNTSNQNGAGLALALGGASMRLNDLVVLYAGLANEGQVRPLRWFESEALPIGRSVMSPKAAQAITKALQQAPTPAGHIPHWLSDTAAPIAYKTGTSYGFRDAWSAGYTKDWTVIVWVGRPDGAPRLGETGRKAAAPVMFDIFSRLPNYSSAYEFKKDEAAPIGLEKLSESNGPILLFPPEGAEIYRPKFGSNSRGLTFSAEADTEVAYYVNGEKLETNLWKPEAPGFYTVQVRDLTGEVAKSNVRIMGPASNLSLN